MASTLGTGTFGSGTLGDATIYLTVTQANTAGATDGAVLRMVRAPADPAGATDAAVRRLSRAPLDPAGATDSALRWLSGAQLDPAGATDSAAHWLSRALLDPAGATDAALLGWVRLIAATDPAGPADTAAGHAMLTRTELAGATDTAALDGPLMQDLADTFSTGTVPDAGRWPVVSVPADSVVGAGVLTLTDASGWYPAVRSASIYTIADSYLLAKVVPATPSGSNSQQTYMGVDVDGNNFVAVLRDGANLVRMVRESGADSFTTIGAYDPTAMAWWRVRHTGTEWHTAYSADGTAWTEQAGFTTAWTQTANLRAMLQVGKWSGADTTAVGTFDNINTPPLSTTLTPADTGGATDAVTRTRAAAHTDTAGAADSAAVARAAAAAYADTAGAFDAASVAVSRSLALTDLAGATDAVQVLAAGRLAVTDLAGATDVPGLAAERARAATDSAGATDSVLRAATRLLAALDTAGGTDSARVSAGATAAATDPAGATDTVALSLTARRLIADRAGATDAVSAVMARFRAITDLAGSRDGGTVNGLPLFPPIFYLWAGANLGADTITVLDAPLVAADRYGKQVRDWAHGTSTVVEWCSLQPYAASEDTADREFANSHMRLFAPPGTAITAVSRVRYDGTTYEVDGEPGHWRDLDGRPSHVEAVLKRLTG